MKHSLLLLGSALLFPSLWSVEVPLVPLSQPDPAREARVAWHREVRFGGFVHWGVYSDLGNEWEGRAGGTYAEHIMRVMKIPRDVYLERVAKPFNPVKFDAEEWVKLMHETGMRYLIVTAKHHDGFAMYPSAHSDFDLTVTPFKRDPMRELRDACAKQGIKFGFYYSHAFDWEHPDAPGNDWDYTNPGGDLLLHGGRDWFLHAPKEYVEKARRYVDEKSIPQIKELLLNYQPDILWFDTPHKLSPEDNQRILRAVRETAPNVVVNGRLVRGYGDYINTADRPAEIPYTDGHWEGIPTTNESYGYSKFDHSHKTPEHFVQLLAKMVSKGGNMLLNIGPRGDGTIDPKDQEIFRGVGRWMARYGESIHGAGRTPLAVQGWGTSTLKGNRLYLHVFDWPKDGRLLVAGLRSDPTSARILAAPSAAPLAVKRVNVHDLEIAVPAGAPDAMNSILVLEFDETPRADFVRLLLPRGEPTRLHVFDGQLVGSRVGFMDGKRNRDATTNWSAPDSGVDWPVRVSEPRRVRVAANYSTSNNSGGTFQIDFGGRVLAADVQRTTNPTTFETFELGEVELPAGEYTVSIRPVTITGRGPATEQDAELTPGEIAARAEGAQLMHLRQLELTPVE